MTVALEAYAVLLVAAFNLVLGAVILTHDARNKANRYFAMLSASAVLWGIGTGIFLLMDTSDAVLFDFFARSNYFFGGLIPTVFLYYTMVYAAARPPSRLVTGIIFSIPLVFGYLYFVTPLIIVAPHVDALGVRGFVYGPWRPLFDLHVWAHFIAALCYLVARYRRAEGEVRHQIVAMVLGTYFTLGVAGVFNITLPHFLGRFEYIWVGPVAIIIWVCAMGYAVARYQLFNIRAISTDMVIVFLWLALLLRTYLSTGRTEILINASFFVAILVLGMSIIASVLKEERQRELIEQQEEQLARVHRQQESLLHFISHEVKGYLAKSEAAFAGIGEGDYGAVSAPLAQMAGAALKDVQSGALMASNILDAANLKHGTVGYTRAPFDLAQVVREVVAEMQPTAAAKGLLLKTATPLPTGYQMLGDENKIRRHVIGNLIDNAIKYTPEGSVTVELSRSGAAARLVVEDTGIGITSEDMNRLFTEGGHGKDSLKVNVHSTGFGLFIAKQVVDAHAGSIHALSAGAGKGTRFVVELPLTSEPAQSKSDTK